MEILLSLSIAMFVGLMLSRAAKFLKLPAVTAYLIAGILVGPYCLGAIGVDGLGFTSMQVVEEFSILKDIALGFIAFSMGNEFRIEKISRDKDHIRLFHLCKVKKRSERGTEFVTSDLSGHGIKSRKRAVKMDVACM